ncbi:MAG: alginate export family protein [Phycisphaeraceae bacterium]|nr:alginate export family protein [Phycisphaeraceae bacterium]
MTLFRLHRSRQVGFVVVGLLCAGGGAALAAGDEPVRPRFESIRYLEDWSLFRPVEPGRPLDGLKHVPLDESGDVWVRFGGDARIRGEYWRNFNFVGGSAGEDAYLLSRLMAHVDLHLGEHFRVFVEGKSALASDRDLPGGRRTSDVNALDLQNAFVELAAESTHETRFSITAGRREMSLGRGRIVGTSAFSNSSRTLDGLTATVEEGPWVFTGFWARQPRTLKYRFDDGNGGRTVYGIYAVRDYAIECASGTVDLYWIGLDRPEVRFNGDAGDERRHTVGTRLSGKFGNIPLDYDFEAAVQFGSVGSADATGYMLAAEVGYTFAGMWGKPRVYGLFDVASGDDRAGDGDVRTWSQGLSAMHSPMGITDVIGRQNIMDVGMGLTLNPDRRWRITAEAHWFFREQTADAMYDSGGRVLFPGSAGSARELGQEILLRVTYRATEQLTFNLGAARFFAGDFVEQAGAGRDIDFIYLEGSWRF